MKNPYEPPSSELEGRSAASDTGLFPLILSVVFAVLSALIPTAATPSFKVVFDSFGTELPMVTQLFFDYYLLLWSLPILVIVVHFSWPKKRKLPLWLGIFSLVLTIPLSMWAMYSPVFHVSQVL
jgi:type II secretory pathway component PulF